MKMCVCKWKSVCVCVWVCVCVCVCVRACVWCVRACACARVQACVRHTHTHTHTMGVFISVSRCFPSLPPRSQPQGSARPTPSSEMLPASNCVYFRVFLFVFYSLTHRERERERELCDVKYKPFGLPTSQYSCGEGGLGGGSHLLYL